MRLRPLVASLEFVAGAAATALLFVGWFQSPVLGHIGLSAWRVIGLVIAAALGATWTFATGSASRVSAAVTLGLLVGAYDASWGDDVARTLFSRVAAGLTLVGFDAALLFASSVVGAVAAGYVLRQRRAAA
jgi:hypothetical protein